MGQPPKLVRPSLANVKSAGASLPPRTILHAVEKWGKTSFGACAPDPIFLMTEGETGLQTLIDANQLPETPYLPPNGEYDDYRHWEELLGAVEMLTEEAHKYKTLVVDTGNGAERLNHQMVCARDYNGDWTDSGFMGYQRGYETALQDWRKFLNALDRLREQRKMWVLFLVHSQVQTFKNPEGPDYDHYVPDMNKKTWSLTHKWADMILFGNFFTVVEGGETGKKAKKGKGMGGQQRFVYTQHHAAYDAGNRYGLPEMIDMGYSPQDAWDNFVQAMKTAKNGTTEEG